MILLQPQDAIAIEGGNSVFSVYAKSNSGKIDYEWFLGETPVGGNSRYINVEDVSMSDNDSKFMVKVTSDGATENSRVATMTVIKKLVIVSDLANTTVKNGEKCTLKVSASGGSGIYSYSWIKNGIPINNDKDSISFVANLNDQKSVYSAVVTDGKQTINSVAATITVIEPIVIVSHTKEVNAYSGRDVSISMEIEGSGASSAKYTWYKDDVIETTEKEYRFKASEDYDGSVVYGTASVGTDTVRTEDIPIYVSRPIPDSDKIKVNARVLIGDDVVLSASKDNATDVSVSQFSAKDRMALYLESKGVFTKGYTDKIGNSKYWDAISSFWSSLSEEDKDDVEVSWAILEESIMNINVDAAERYRGISPYLSDDRLSSNIIEIDFNILDSDVIGTNPFDSNTKNITVNEVRDTSVDGSYSDFYVSKSVYDMVVLYEKLYVIVSTVDGVVAREIVSSKEESNGSKHEYSIKAKVDSKTISDPSVIQITDGKSYEIDDSIIDIQRLSGCFDGVLITIEKGVDFNIVKNLIVLNNLSIVRNAEKRFPMFGYNIPQINTHIENDYGSVVGGVNRSVTKDNVSIKAFVNSILNSTQNPNVEDSIKIISNQYAGLPVAPYIGQCIGVFESYEYVVKKINKE